MPRIEGGGSVGFAPEPEIEKAPTREPPPKGKTAEMPIMAKDQFESGVSEKKYLKTHNENFAKAATFQEKMNLVDKLLLTNWHNLDDVQRKDRLALAYHQISSSRTWDKIKNFFLRLLTLGFATTSDFKVSQNAWKTYNTYRASAEIPLKVNPLDGARAARKGYKNAIGDMGIHLSDQEGTAVAKLFENNEKAKTAFFEFVKNPSAEFKKSTLKEIEQAFGGEKIDDEDRANLTKLLDKIETTLPKLASQEKMVQDDFKALNPRPAEKMALQSLGEKDGDAYDKLVAFQKNPSANLRREVDEALNFANISSRERNALQAVLIRVDLGGSLQKLFGSDQIPKPIVDLSLNQPEAYEKLTQLIEKPSEESLTAFKSELVQAQKQELDALDPEDEDYNREMAQLEEKKQFFLRLLPKMMARSDAAGAV